jgi:Uma2 family endonuclease
MSTTQGPGVRQKCWDKQEYYRLGELGFFQDQRVELIEGQLMVHSPQNALHADGVEAVTRVVGGLFGSGYRVRCQLPLDFGQTTEPEPDLAVLVTTPLFQGAHPTTALLVVEVADSTLDYDRGTKASLYAWAGIPDYWIVNLVDNQVEIYRDPLPDATAPFRYRYSNRTDLQPPATVSPLALPHAVVALADLLP